MVKTKANKLLLRVDVYFKLENKLLVCYIYIIHIVVLCAFHNICNYCGNLGKESNYSRFK